MITRRNVETRRMATCNIKRLLFIYFSRRIKILTLFCVTAMILLRNKFFYFDKHLSDSIELLTTDDELSSLCMEQGWTLLRSSSSKTINKPKVFDASFVNFELDMLDVRLHELDTVVDFFVIVESTLTFSGKPKPLYYELNKSRFAKFADKIIHIVNDSIDLSLAAAPDGKGGYTALSEKDAKKLYVIHKRGILKGLEQASPNDIIIVSDIDEIPRHEVIKLLSSCKGYNTPVELHTTPYMYDFGCPDKKRPLWRRAKVIHRKDLELNCNGYRWDGKYCTQELRENQHSYGDGIFFRQPTSVSNAGWHMSSFMEIEDIRLKLASNVHTPRNTESNRQVDFINCMIYTCQHINRVDYGERTFSKPQIHQTGPRWARTSENPSYEIFYNRKLDPSACARVGMAHKKAPKKIYDGLFHILNA